MTPFQLANTAEGLLWMLLGVGMLWFSARRAHPIRQSLLIAATLVIFGASDFVEAQTGAWWRPWWLLLWKGTCVLLLLALLLQHYRRSARP